MICDACKGKPHSGQPINCDGGTWCDCQHRPILIENETKEEGTSNE